MHYLAFVANSAIDGTPPCWRQHESLNWAARSVKDWPMSFLINLGLSMFLRHDGRKQQETWIRWTAKAKLINEKAKVHNNLGLTRTMASRSTAWNTSFRPSEPHSAVGKTYLVTMHWKLYRTDQHLMTPGHTKIELHALTLPLSTSTRDSHCRSSGNSPKSSHKPAFALAQNWSCDSFSLRPSS